MGVNNSTSKCKTVGIEGIAWSFGGHINPALTFGLFRARKLSFTRAIFYIILQCLGAICGTGVVKGFQQGLYKGNGSGANIVAPGYTKGNDLGTEIVGTFILVYTVFSATNAKRIARESHVPWIFWVGPVISTALAAIYHQVIIREIPFKGRS